MEKDYDEFVQRMGSFDMVLGEDQEVQEELKHFGVKGMKWSSLSNPMEIPKKYRNMFIATTSKVNER